MNLFIKRLNNKKLFFAFIKKRNNLFKLKKVKTSQNIFVINLFFKKIFVAKKKKKDVDYFYKYKGIKFNE